MSLERSLKQRSNSQCELCANTDNLRVYEVPASPGKGEEASILICSVCEGQIENPETVDPNHWRCLNDSASQFASFFTETTNLSKDELEELKRIIDQQIKKK